MTTDPEPDSYHRVINLFIDLPFGLADSLMLQSAPMHILYISIILLLLFLSATFSSAEIAFFSLSPTDVEGLSNDSRKSARTVQKLLNEPNKKDAPKQLLATILLSNNFVNIALVIISSVYIDIFIGDKNLNILYSFLIKVVLVTFLLVLFGEIVPKIYATKHKLKIANNVSGVLNQVQKNSKLLINLLVKSTSLIENRWEMKNKEVSVDDLNKAIDITSETRDEEEQLILKGLINLGSISVTEIMKSRVEISGVDESTSFDSLIEKVKEWNYSRIPVYQENLDNVIGLIYIKDLIPLLSSNKTNQKKWAQLIRKPFFVPESKKIDDLMQNFQEEKIHLALVVDEYGGTSGLVTMEDILEEIFGEIKDEFDDDEWIYSKLDEDTFVFEGKIMLNDMIKIANLGADYFSEIDGDFDTLSGLVLEIAQGIPKIGERVEFKEVQFVVEKSTHRKIDRIKLKKIHENN
ncbi:MAG: hypothetical protein CNE98_06550 [Bacteroidetes bacterium MED-G17]|nr:MAG: hypothetical protein CBB99_02460 [Bacteroidetes bacterium TMED39]PDH51981.1 MAG: hypothetical protein CNE98_06550 [Bacteroidetes bacterium MED-G17]|tara:strand:+ start:13736 stop:15127 length:1392 start_codon:yes stop_codon:yes gene_type:complete